MLELLSPAKNLEFGQAAISHGADAVYIGAPAFGARASATNSIQDIESLVRYAHLYHAKVYATVNTLLFDNEIEDAVRMIRQLYECGTDALIIQDLGLLQCDLPPIELHASTQCHNHSIERVQMLQQLGFSRVILARETSLEEMKAIRQATTVELEAFVHGALCVSYSGQCYMSHFLTGRSGNRGECAQPCRSRYDLLTADGEMLVRDRHLLSLRDFNASRSLSDMAAAGICSFKIEGRLKDLSYVKNITAHYRLLLDQLLHAEGSPYTAASSGHTSFFFTPDPTRTFNRGYTDYFLHHRQPMANFDTAKSLGKEVGKVATVGHQTLTIDGPAEFAPGDGLCFIDSERHLQGFHVNQVQGHIITPNHMPPVRIGTPLWRNHDHLFEKMLEGNTAERKIGIEMLFSRSRRGFCLDIKDEDGTTVAQYVAADHTECEKAIRQSNTIVKQLGKLGNTPFEATKIIDSTEGHFFVGVGMLNDLRRKAVQLLIEKRSATHLSSVQPRPPIDSNTTTLPPHIDALHNIVNRPSEELYRAIGATDIVPGTDLSHNYADHPLMTTRYCLRYELGWCLREGGGKPGNAELMLRNNGRLFRLHFDCTQCQMQIFATDATVSPQAETTRKS